MTTLNNNPLTLSTNSSKHEERYEPAVNLDLEPSLSDLSETYSSNSRAKKNKGKKRKKQRKHQKDDLSNPSSSDDSDSSNDSDYRRKRRKSKKHRKKNPIKQCATLTTKLYQFQQETAIMKIKSCIHFWITFTMVKNTQLR